MYRVTNHNVSLLMTALLITLYSFDIYIYDDEKRKGQKNIHENTVSRGKTPEYMQNGAIIVQRI